MIIKNDKGEFLEFALTKREDDKFFVTINAKSSFLSISYNTTALFDSLKKLYFVLSLINKNKKGSFSLDTLNLDNDFNLEIKYDLSGEVFVIADIKSNKDFGNQCSICFLTKPQFIQSFLTELHDEIK